MNPILILGTGLAGYTVAREFRKLDTTTPLTLITRDDGSFYSKPVLSNALAQKKSAAQIALNSAADMTRQLQATIHTNLEVTAIDTAARTVTTRNGPVLAYDRLVLALGADPMVPPMAGDGAADVMTINDLADYARWRERLEGRQRVAIIGAGLIGCEFANDLRLGGFEATVIDPADRPIARLLPPATANALRGALEQAGVNFRFNTTVREIVRAGEANRLTLANGESFDADLVLAATGLRPRIALATGAGLMANLGILTDTQLAASAPNVYALGDCAEVAGYVLPYVMPLMQAARALAKTLAGQPTAVQYPAMPVAIKTPALPAVVMPPPVRAEGAWEETATSDGVRALFYDKDRTLRGFALVGSATSEKMALTKQIPPLIA